MRVRFSAWTIAYYLAAAGAMYVVIMGFDTGRSWSNLATKIPVGVVLMAAAVIVREKEIRTHASQYLRRLR